MNTTLQTTRQKSSYGELCGVTTFSVFATGSVKACNVIERNELETTVGTLVPQYREAELGERQKKHRNALAFWENGRIRSVALEEEIPIKTSIGTYMAELVTFHEDGSLNRLFPLNGRIDGYWTENDERERAVSMPLRLPIGEFEAKVIGMRFYPSGALRSVTLWPGEKVKLETPLGMIRVGSGFSLYEDGSLESIEPSRPTKVDTPIGSMLAFDTEIIGMHADENSLSFYPNGGLKSLKTVNSGVRYTCESGDAGILEPLQAASLIDINDTRTIPLKIDFLDTEIHCYTPELKVFEFASCKLEAFRREVFISSGCSSCSGCSSAPEERCANSPESCDKAECCKSGCSDCSH